MIMKQVFQKRSLPRLSWVSSSVTTVEDFRTASPPSTARCSHQNCSSYNLGFPLINCVRICSIVGMISSVLYIAAGTSLITHISQSENISFSAYAAQQSLPPSTRHIYYKRNAGFFIGIAVMLVLLNAIQLMSDLLLLISSLKGKQQTSLWVFIVVDITLWTMTLICFITIFSGGGMFLLLVFLMGTAVRAYITFILYEFMMEKSKLHRVEEDEEENFTPVPTPKTGSQFATFPSPIMEETMDPYAVITDSSAHPTQFEIEGNGVTTHEGEETCLEDCTRKDAGVCNPLVQNGLTNGQHPPSPKKDVCNDERPKIREKGIKSKEAEDSLGGIPELPFLIYTPKLSHA